MALHTTISVAFSFHTRSYGAPQILRDLSWNNHDSTAEIPPHTAIPPSFKPDLQLWLVLCTVCRWAVLRHHSVLQNPYIITHYHTYFFIFQSWAQKIFTSDSLGDLNTRTRIKSLNKASQISTPRPLARTIQQSCIPCLQTPNGSAIFDIDGPKVPLYKHLLWGDYRTLRFACCEAVAELAVIFLIKYGILLIHLSIQIPWVVLLLMIVYFTFHWRFSQIQLLRGYVVFTLQFTWRWSWASWQNFFVRGCWEVGNTSLDRGDDADCWLYNCIAGFESWFGREVLQYNWFIL